MSLVSDVEPYTWLRDENETTFLNNYCRPEQKKLVLNILNEQSEVRDMKTTMLIDNVEAQGKISYWKYTKEEGSFTCLDSFYIGNPVPFKSIVHFNLYSKDGKREVLQGRNLEEFMKFKELFIHRSMYDELFLFSTNNAG